MNVAENLNRIIQAKADLKSVINSIEPTLIKTEQLSEYILALQKIFNMSRVVFIDYDGTVLKDEYCYVGDDLVPPIVPDHTDEGLVFTEWNWDTSVEKVGPIMMVIGACYTTVDGLNHFHINLTANLTLTITTQFLTSAINKPFAYQIFWGDGTESTLYTNVNGTYSHTYSIAGEYVVKMSVTSPDNNRLNVSSSFFNLANAITKMYFASNLKYFQTSTTSIVLKRITFPQILESANIWSMRMRTYIFPRGLVAVSVIQDEHINNLSLPKHFTNFKDKLQKARPRLISLSHLLYPIFSGYSFVNNLLTEPYLNQLINVSSLMFAGNTKLKNINLSAKSGAQSLIAEMFNHCTNVTSIQYYDPQIATGTEIIPQYFAEGCFRLESISNVAHVTKVDKFAFKDCFSFKPNLSLFTNLALVEEKAFYACALNDNFVLPPSITNIYSNAFSNTKIKTFTIPVDSLLVSCSDGFLDSTEIESIELRPSLSSVNFTIQFSNCAKLTSLIIHEGLTNTGRFSGAVLLTSIILPSTIKSISTYAFQGCINLETINLPTTLLTVGSYAFQNCKKLNTPIVLPIGVTQLSGPVFEGCELIPSVQFSEAFASIIGDYTFKNCHSLVSIEFPATLNSFSGRYTFSGCRNLVSVIFNSANPGFGSNIFEYCISLINVVLPYNLAALSYMMFRNCVALPSITLPDTIANLNTSTFDGCINLESIVIPPGVTIIGTYVFANCNKLAYVDFRRCTLASIQHYAFKDCNVNPKQVLDFSNYTIIPTLAATKTTVFGSGVIEVWVPFALLDAWRAATNWSSMSASIIGV